MRHTPHRAGIFIGKAVLHFAGLMKLATFACVRKVFPAIPSSWKDVSFKDLRTEGAFLVSASLEAGRLSGLSVYSEKGGHLRLKHHETGEIVERDMKPVSVWRYHAEDLFHVRQPLGTEACEYDFKTAVPVAYFRQQTDRAVLQACEGRISGIAVPDTFADRPALAVVETEKD